MLLSIERDVAALQMDTRFPRYLDAFHCSNGMVQLWPILLKPAFNGAPSRGYAATRSLYEFHVLRYEGEEVVSPFEFDFYPPVPYEAHIVICRRNLARMHGILQERRANEYGPATHVPERGCARTLDAWEWARFD